MNTTCCFCKAEDCTRKVVTAHSMETKKEAKIWNPVCEECISKTKWVRFEARKIKNG